MKVRLELSARAQLDAGRIDSWWRENRRGSPGLFARELRRTLALLVRVPGMGAHYEASIPRLRRYFLRKTGHHIYYVVDELRNAVLVVTIWNSAGESGPVL